MQPIDQKRKRELPSVTGYVVKKEDTLWSIAKNYYTTIENIKAYNELESDTLEPGERLVILKDA